MTGWRAWFAGGQSFNSKEHDVSSLPTDGVLVIMLFFDKGRRVLHGTDWYFTTSSGVWEQAMGGDYLEDINNGISVPDAIRKRYPNAHVMRGIALPKEEWDTVLKLAYRSDRP